MKEADESWSGPVKRSPPASSASTFSAASRISVMSDLARPPSGVKNFMPFRS